VDAVDQTDAPGLLEELSRDELIVVAEPVKGFV